MATLTEVLEGLKILAKYDSGSICAEHDVIFAGPQLEDVEMTEEDEKALKAYGWHQDQEGNCWARFV